MTSALIGHALVMKPPSKPQKIVNTSRWGRVALPGEGVEASKENVSELGELL